MTNGTHNEAGNIEWIRKSYKVIVGMISNLKNLLSLSDYIQKPHCMVQENNQMLCYALMANIFGLLNLA